MENNDLPLTGFEPMQPAILQLLLCLVKHWALDLSSSSYLQHSMSAISVSTFLVTSLSAASNLSFST
jgi:hypothetical protein